MHVEDEDRIAHGGPVAGCWKNVGRIVTVFLARRKGREVMDNGQWTVDNDGPQRAFLAGDTPMSSCRTTSLALPLGSIVAMLLLAASTLAQPLGKPDRGAPGDAMIQNYLARQTERIGEAFSADVANLATWQANRARYVDEYYYML